MTSHLEPVMGTVVGFASPHGLPAAGIAEARRVLHEADRVFSTWKPESPVSRLRSGRVAIHELDPGDAEDLYEVLHRCALARELTGGAFDPWAMPGGLDPTGLVKGWAAARALRALTAAGAQGVLVNAGGDIAVAGEPPNGAWRIGIRDPHRTARLAAVVEVSGAVATSGDYERPGQLLDPRTGAPARSEVASATVTGPELDLADALATALAVAGPELLAQVDALDGYAAFVVMACGRLYATPGMPFAA